ncbi:DNA repair protein RecO [Candidatus Aerophobetes bacterium]|nr:DNA repair protein RecO [Candidatus Aerophobetes bacterium]
MNTLKTRGIALTSYELFEQDKIVTFYTQNFGMLKAVAKGARKIKSRFAPVVQFPSYVDIYIYKRESSQMGTLTDCRTRYLFPKIRTNIFRFAYASYVAEILLGSLKGEEQNHALFSLLLKAFFLLEDKKEEDFDILICSFKLKLLYILGYTPEFRICVECGRKRDFFISFYFNLQKGGILCERCQGEDFQAIGVPKLTVLAMDYMMRNGMSCSFKPQIHKVKKQINFLLDAYFLYHVNSNEKKNNSQGLIKQLEKLR